MLHNYFFSACHQLENGIQAIFGPTDPLLGAHIQSICEALDVPHVEARIGKNEFFIAPQPLGNLSRKHFK